ncbi:MAG: phospholipid carrier-dependent glycosyltransferase, partial [Gemmatimonadota bacterium]
GVAAPFGLAEPGVGDNAEPETVDPGLTPVRRSKRAWLAALVIALVAGGLAATASLRTSTTFDEIVLMAGGARGWETGRWDLAPEHPPLMQYVYGLPIHLIHPHLPPERAIPENQGFTVRYTYAREFFWTTGNDPERMAFLGRLPGALCVVLLVLGAFGLASRIGPVQGLLAAGLVAFVPDVLAHGGVAYNDLPMALAYLVAIAAGDVAVRRPSVWRGALAGAAAALALSVKFSAVVVAPAVALLIAFEAMSRRFDRRWLVRLAPALLAGVATAYLCMVVVYRGDFTLAEMRYGLEYTFGHVTRGHSAPGYLVGQLRHSGWRWFFPLAFLYKTPAALHLLLLVSLLGFARSTRGASIRRLLASPLRAPLTGLAVFLAALMASSLVIGFRYALPALPLLCIIVAAGAVHVWNTSGRRWRVGLAALVLAYVVSSASAWPHYLGYTSEYGGGGDAGHELLADSSLDWGQGLLELRSWMRENGVDRVYLSYFGSAVPAGYGINYVPLWSAFPLPMIGPVEPRPKYAVISATNLHGLYLPADPFARFRELEPITVLAHSLLVYRVQ